MHGVRAYQCREESGGIQVVAYLYLLFFNGGHDIVDNPDAAHRLFEEYSTTEQTPRVIAIEETMDITSEFE